MKKGDPQKKDMARKDYLELYKKTAEADLNKKVKPYTEQAEDDSPAKKKLRLRERSPQAREQIPPTEQFLHQDDSVDESSLRKLKQVTMEKQSREQPASASKLRGTALHADKVDYEISQEEATIQHLINPRQNIIQARSYIRVEELPETPSGRSGSGEGSSSDFDPELAVSKAYSITSPMPTEKEPKWVMGPRGFARMDTSELNSKVHEIKIQKAFQFKEMNW